MSTITKKLVAGTSILALAAPFALSAALAQDAPPPTSQPAPTQAPPASEPMARGTNRLRQRIEPGMGKPAAESAASAALRRSR